MTSTLPRTKLLLHSSPHNQASTFPNLSTHCSHSHQTQGAPLPQDLRTCYCLCLQTSSHSSNLISKANASTPHPPPVLFPSHDLKPPGHFLSVLLFPPQKQNRSPMREGAWADCWVPSTQHIICQGLRAPTQAPGWLAPRWQRRLPQGCQRFPGPAVEAPPKALEAAQSAAALLSKSQVGGPRGG